LSDSDVSGKTAHVDDDVDTTIIMTYNPFIPSFTKNEKCAFPHQKP